MSINFNPIAYNPHVNFSQLSSLEIAINNNDIEALNKILNSDEFSHFPTPILKNSLQSAMGKNQLNIIEALLNSDRSDELTLESLDLLLTQDDMSFINRIIESKVFNEIPIGDLKNALDTLISADKTNIVKLILNTFRFYEFEREEIFQLLEIAARNNNITLFRTILDCNNLEDIPEDIFKNCFDIAEDQYNIEIIKLLLNSRKTSDIPMAIFYEFENAQDPKSIEMAKALINSRKFDRVSNLSLERAFVNAINKDTPLVRCLINSNKVDQISISLLQENFHHKAVKHYLDFLSFHKNSPMQYSSVHTKMSFLDQNDGSAIEILRCKKCNKEAFLSTTTLIDILHACIIDNRYTMLDAILNSERIIDIDEANFINLLQHALKTDKVDVINKFIEVDAEKSERYLQQIFENAIFNNDIQTIKNILGSNTNLPCVSSLNYAVQNNNLSLIEVIISSNKISQEDLFISLCDVVNNIILNPKDDLLVKIFHKFMLHNDSLTSLKLTLENCEEKQLFLLESAIKKELIEITREVLYSPTFSIDFIRLLLEHEAVNNDPNSLVALLSYPGFSTEELSPLLERAKIADNPNIIEAFIKSNKISTEKTLELFDDAVKNGKRRMLCIISSSDNISKEDLERALKICLINDNEGLSQVLINSKNLSEDDISNVLIDLSKSEDINITKRLVFSGALTVNRLKLLEKKIQDQNILGIFKQYYELHKQRLTSEESPRSYYNSYFN